MSTPPTPQTPTPPIAVGTRLTDYSSLDLVVEGSAEGGFGLVVWGPNQADGGQMSALKLLRPDLLAHAEAQSPVEGERMRREFEREALTWCHLWPHANIVTADALTRLPGWDNLPVLVLEYAPRGSVRQVLSEAHRSSASHLALNTALVWGQQIAAALAVIHQPDPTCERPDPLVHCDLKPENVLLNSQGWALLTDLGLTRVYAATTLGLSAVTAGAPDDAAIAAHVGQEISSERDVRVARMRAALQAAGLLSTRTGDPPAAATVPAAGGAALGTARDARFLTRSVRVPPLSAALLSTLLTPHPGSPPSAAPVPSQTLSHDEPGIGSRGPALGTPPYMPPEQWWGLDAVTPASDVYALGVLLFELFAGGRWSQRQQRWLDDDQEDAGTGERYVRFPHAPQFSAEALAYLEGWGGLAGQQAYFAAWYAAHRAGPRWRLADPAVGALTRGPLMDVGMAGARERPVAQQAVTALSDLIAACLAPEAAQRPTAAAVQRWLGEIAQMVGEEPLVIPEVFARTREHQAVFWGDLAITYSKIGQHEEQLRLNQRVVTLDPETPHRWLNLGAALAYLKRHEEALAALAEAERCLTPAYQARDPHRAARMAVSIPNNQANALGSLGRFEEAVGAYHRALALRPDWADTRFNLALTLMRWSKEDDASRAQQIERLRAAHVEIRQVLSEAPAIANGQALLADIERALARLGNG